MGGSGAPDIKNLNRSKLFIRRTYTDFSFLGEAKQTHTEEVGSDDKKKAGTVGVLEAHELSQKDDSEQQGGAKSAAQRRKDTSVQLVSPPPQSLQISPEVRTHLVVFGDRIECPFTVDES
jgi:outer membrane scaffolding protein for murein synthesis (MipA/OmpV family)